MKSNSLDDLYSRFARRGDVAALAAVFDRVAPSLLRLARCLATEPSQAEDLVQDVFLTAIEQPEAYDPARPVGAWLVGILVNRGREARRREERRPDPDRLQVRTIEEPSARLEQREWVAAVADGLKHLPLGERAAVVGRLFEGVTGTELARRLDITPGNLRVRLHRGLARLRAALPPGLALGLWGWVGARRALAPLRARVLEAALEKGGTSLTGVQVAAMSSAGWVMGALGLVAVVATAMLAADSEGVSSPAVLLLESDVELVSDPTPREESAASRMQVEVPATPVRVEYQVLVVDGANRPLAGIEVLATLAGPGQQESRATSDEHGLARFDLDTERELRKVEALPSPTTGLAREWVRQVVGELEELLILRVEAGGTLSGRVVDGEGRPVVGATVQGWCQTRVEGAAHRSATTQADGAFVIEYLGPDFVVVARAPGMVSTRSLRGSLEPGEVSRDHELSIGREESLEGQVVDPNGLPVGGVRIWSELGYGAGSSWLNTHHPHIRGVTGSTAETSTDATGNFRLLGVAGKTVVARFARAPFLTAYNRLRPDQNPQRVVLDPGLSLTGEVIDANGAPVAGARVSFGPGFGLQTTPTFTHTDAHGQFRLVGMGPEDSGYAPWFLLVVHAGYAVQVVQPVEPGREGGRHVTVSMEPAMSIRGRVVDADRRGVAGVEVSVEGPREYEPGVNYGRRPTWEWKAGVDTTSTDEEGRFEFDQLYGGNFSVRATAPWDEHEEIGVTARAGASDVEIVLDRTQVPGGSASGRVVDEVSGQPVPRYTLTPMRFVGGFGSGMGRVITDANGRWEVRGLEPGTYDFAFHAEGYAPASSPKIDVLASHHELGEVRLWRTASFHFRLVDGDGHPVGGANLVFLEPDGTPIKEVPFRAPQGRGIVHELPARPLLLQISWSSSSREFPIDLSHDRGDEFEFVLLEEPRANLVLTFLEVDERVSDVEALKKFEQRDTDEGRKALRSWLQNGAASIPAGRVSVALVEQDGTERATGSLEPEGGGSFKTETTTKGSSTSMMSSTEHAPPQLRFSLRARTYTLRLKSDLYAETIQLIDLRDPKSSQQLVILRRR